MLRQLTIAPTVAMLLLLSGACTDPVVEHRFSPEFLAWGVAGGYAVAYSLLLTSWLIDLADGGTRDELIEFFLPPVVLVVSMFAIPSGLAMGLVACAVLRGLEPRRASASVIKLSIVGTAIIVLTGAALDSPPVFWIGLYLVRPVAMALVRRRMGHALSRAGTERGAG